MGSEWGGNAHRPGRHCPSGAESISGHRDSSSSSVLGNQKVEIRKEKRDFSLRRPTHFRPDRNLRSQERTRKKKSACFVLSRRNIPDAPKATDVGGGYAGLL